MQVERQREQRERRRDTKKAPFDPMKSLPHFLEALRRQPGEYERHQSRQNCDHRYPDQYVCDDWPRPHFHAAALCHRDCK